MTLYVWGKNTTHQLGLNQQDKVIFDITRVNALHDQYLVDFSAGLHHSLAVNEFGDVYAWGRGKEGQLGLGQHHIHSTLPQRITTLDGEMITKVSCGETHSLGLSITGEVFMWGLLPETREVKHDGMFDNASVSLTGLETNARSNAQGIVERIMRGSELIYEIENMTKHDLDDSTETSLEYMHSTKMQTVRYPCFIPRKSISLLRHTIITIASGFAHSLAVSDQGIVFSCGYNDNGQLGIGTRRNVCDFVPVNGLKEHFMTQVACGQQHSLALSRTGFVFAWGLGILGQLGLGINISWLPMQVHMDQPVVSIAAGSHHSVAVTQEGTVFTWGHSEYGQHGVGESGRDLQHGLYYFFPRPQESLVAEQVVVRHVACSSHSTFAVTSEGHLYAWGWNAHGILGMGKYQHSAFPQRIAFKDLFVCHVSAGANHCGVIVKPHGCHYSLHYDRVLKGERFYDVEFVVANGDQVVRAHQVIICARSHYLDGLLRVIRSNVEHHGVWIVDLFQDVERAIMEAFLLYLYTDKVHIASHKRRVLQAFALRVCMEDLANLCQVTWQQEQRQLPSDSQFEFDMGVMVLNPLYADVELLWPIHNKDSTEHVYERLPAHKAVLSQMEYFNTMFHGGFREGQILSGVHQILLHHMPQDGISLAAFKTLLSWIYSGSIRLLKHLNPMEIMDLYVAANLMSFTILANLCELQLIACLPKLQDSDSIQACMDFAIQFDARRLKTLSQRLLNIQ